MAIPTPPLDKAGGYFIIKYANGTNVHRMRVHVLAFNDDATGSYIAPPGGGEASVNATFTALAGFLAPKMNNGFTMSLDAYFHVDAVTGAATETFAPSPPATVAGTNGGAATINEMYECMSMRTTAGKPVKFFVFQSVSAAPGAPVSVVPNVAGTTNQKLVAYLQAATTAILGHDGHKPNGNAKAVDGYNRKLRRKQGDA